MGFWLNQSARRLLSSSWAPAKPIYPLRVLTSLKNNCFSTASGGMNQQESNPKDDAAFKEDTPVTAAERFGYKFFSALLQKKPLPPPDDPDFHQFVDDLIDKLPDAETKDTESETVDQSEKPKPTTSEMIKATSVFYDAISLGLLGIIPKPPAFKAKGENFNFTEDTNGLYLTVKVCGLPIEDIAVWVDRNLFLHSAFFGDKKDDLEEAILHDGTDHSC